MSFDNLSNVHMDVLQEIGNIGAGNAATSMAELINERVEMGTPSVNIVTFDEMMDIIGGPEELIVAMYFKVHGKAPGTVYFILTMEEAEYLVDKTTAGSVKLNFLSDEEPNDMAISALKEVGNIIIGSYLSALSDFININMQSSIPYLGVDMAGAILTVGLIELSQDSDYAIVIDAKIKDHTKKEGIHGHFFFLPNPESLPIIFSALGINDDD